MDFPLTTVISPAVAAFVQQLPVALPPPLPLPANLVETLDPGASDSPL
jgi:hypothetical protein